MVNLIIFILGFFIDFFEIAFILIPLIAQPAETLGIDLIWLGVILGMNMQTSFLTPPFGFALFYLRSVAAKVPYLDRVTGRNIEGIKTSEIYRGAVSFIAIQVVMIVVVVAFPGMVMHYKGPVVDPSSVQITVPSLPTLQTPGAAPGQPGLGGLPQLGAPQLGAPQLGQPQLGQPQLGQPQLGAPQLGAPQVTPGN